MRGPFATLVVAAGLVIGPTGLTGCSDGPAVGPTGPVVTLPAPSSPTTTSGTSASSSPASGSPASPGRVPALRGTDVVEDSLEVPWGLDFLPDRSALVAERDSGRIVRLQGGRRQVLATVPGVRHGGEGGLLGLLVVPHGDTTLVLAYVTSTADDNRILLMEWQGGRLSPPRTVLTGIPAAGHHNGGRMALGPDGMVYVGTGDAGRRDAAQDVRSLGGKILRITPVGGVPGDNPFPGSPVWSLGHRNVQGLAFDSAGRLWASEFGQNTWDELNLVRRGGNYGWPLVEGDADDPRFVRPQATWATSEASPSGVAIAGDVAYVAGLRGQRLWQVPLAGGRAGTPRALLEREHGRLRTVAVAPDGSIWVTTSNRDGRGQPRSGDDRVLRLTLG